MNRSIALKLGAGTAALALVAGGGAAYAAGGHAHTFRPALVRGAGGPFGAAATYLGSTPQQIFTQLRSGKTLAQIANATSGKSASGLVDALVAARTQRIDAAVKAGKLTQAQGSQLESNLKQRITDLVNGTFPHRGGPHGFGPRHDTEAVATSYLGLTADQIRTQLRSGKTLAQIADATPGKSASGLVDALAAAARKDIDAAVAAGRLTQAQAAKIEASLTKRITDAVNRTRPAGGGFRHGPGGWLGHGGTGNA
jgi:urease accessory protein UreF